MLDALSKTETVIIQDDRGCENIIFIDYTDP